jgi:alpha-beta hydrolase superfamily lysophospholipase
MSVRRFVRALLVAAIIAAAVSTLGCALAAKRLTQPDRKPVGAAPPDLHAAELTIASESGSALRGWFVAGEHGSGAILLLHGVHANRLAMLRRARLFAQAGYAVLLIDFQAHGESPGENITFGYLESRDARAAFDELQRRAPGECIGIVGVSMGGAAILLAQPPLPANALVLEQVYPTIDEALDNRLRLYLGPLGAWLELPLERATSRRLRLDPAQLRPIDHIGGQHEPIFVIAGDADRHTTLAQSQALFAAAGEPKQLWVVPGAEHVDLADRAPDEYAQRVLAFFAAHVRAPDGRAAACAHPSIAASATRSVEPDTMRIGGME